MNSLYSYGLSSESRPSECTVAVFLRRHIYRYVDEGNYRSVPKVRFEAGTEK